MGDQNKPDKQLDCVGLFCPEPVFRTRKEIDQLAVGEVLELIADDPAAEEDIPRLVKNLGLELLKMFKEDDEIHFLIKKTK
ncbi:MAG: sulfurtransferase TusA family protein [Candidatus Bathyarchaeota archaeon]|jgi:tRNA 2-thiouridine synthesizing protein A